MKRLPAILGFSLLLASTTGAHAQTAKLMIFGGPEHGVYLGCLNCSQYDPDSVYNEHGSYGSSYSLNSIFNAYGEYGSRYSNESACNPYASDPPVIVDPYGRFYGRLTLNLYHPEANDNTSLLEWLVSVCQH